MSQTSSRSTTTSPASPDGTSSSDGTVTDGTASDLDSRSAIHDLVVGFYREIVNDELLGPVFDEVAEVDWTAHIPRLIDYWCRILLDEPVYNGSMFAAHHEVHQRQAFRVEHFDRWFDLWCSSIEARWQGPVADRARSHAARTAALLSRRLTAADWEPPPITGPVPAVAAVDGAIGP